MAFAQTARDVVVGAMRDLGVIGLSEMPGADELAYGIEQLNLLLRGLAADGVTPWTDVETTVDFPAATGVVTLDPRPVDVLEARLAVSASYSRPLTRWTAGEYDLIPDRTQSGVPLAYEILHAPDAVEMRIWPVPSEDVTIAYSYQSVIADVDAGEELAVPQVWGEAIREMLKARLTAFGPVPDDVKMRAAMLRQQLVDFDRPASYFIEPDRYV